MADFNPEDLETALAKDIGVAKKRVESSAEQRGVEVSTDIPTGFGPRAVRIKNKIVGQKEISALDKTMNEVLNDLVQTAQFRDKREEIQKRMEWEGQLRDLKINLLTQGLEFEKMLGSTEADFEKRVAIGTAAGMALGGAARAYTSRSNRTTEDDYTGVADLDELETDSLAYGETYRDPYRLSSTPEGDLDNF